MMAGHLRRLKGQASPLKGIRNLLYGLIANEGSKRAMGCMGVGSVAEFGTFDPELVALRAKGGPELWAGPGRAVARRDK